MITYPPYNIPKATGITWVEGQGTLQQLPDNYRCLQTDAELILKFAEAKLGAGGAGTLINAALTTGFKFIGLDPNDQWQPWFITGNKIPAGPVGPAVALMYVSGIGHPGEWIGIGTGNVHWQDDPDPLPPLVAPNTTPVPADLYAIQGGGGPTLSDIYTLLQKVATKVSA